MNEVHMSVNSKQSKMLQYCLKVTKFRVRYIIINVNILLHCYHDSMFLPPVAAVLLSVSHSDFAAVVLLPAPAAVAVVLKVPGHLTQHTNILHLVCMKERN